MDNLVIPTSAWDLVQIECINGEDREVSDGVFIYLSGLQLSMGKKVYYIGTEFDIKADAQAVTILWGNDRKQHIRVLLSRTSYSTIAELKAALAACKGFGGVQSVTTEIVNGSLIVCVNGVCADPLPLPSGGAGLFDYDGGAGSWIWATAAGVIVTKNQSQSLITITVPDGVDLWKVELVGTSADTNGSPGDLNVNFVYQGIRTFNQDATSAKKPSVQISNGDYTGISPGSPSMVNPNLLYGVSAVGSGDLQVTVINATGYYPTHKLTFLLP